jgi:3'(2'), 5'-bisphosphate nucleotidase
MPNELAPVAALARLAGVEIMRCYAQACPVQLKPDASPVTAADHAAEAIILAGLRELTPDIPVIAEEEVAAGRIPAVADCFWLVDPLDGTKEFISRTGNFTVNIALIAQGRPQLGVIYAPVYDKLYAGDVARMLAWREDSAGRHSLAAAGRPAGGLTVAGSFANHNAATDAYLAGFTVARRMALGSSLKFCLIAEGSADLYPRFGPTMEWDTAAGDAIVRASGGMVYGLDGKPLLYRKSDFYNPGFIASGAWVPAI